MARQQIHSGSILLGFIAGSIITIFAIYATTQSCPLKLSALIQTVKQINGYD